MQQDLMFNKHLGSTYNPRSRGQTAHRSFKNTKQFIEAVADLPEDEDEVTYERKLSRGSGIFPTSLGGRDSDGEHDDDDDLDNDDDLEEDNRPFLQSVSDQQVSAAFELAARCVYCPINHNFEMISTLMANDFEYLKKALGLGRKDLRTELRSAKRKGRLIIDELQQRLNNLDNHYYYKRDSFQTDRLYESWKQNEKTTIERLINQLKQVPAFSANLSIKILGAKDLITKDGVSQYTKPYCTLVLGKTIMRQTQTLEKTTSPTWNEAYNVTVTSLSDQLQIEVLDKILIGSSSLGCVSVPLSELEDQLPVDKWYPLQAKAGEKKKPTGSLHLALHLTYREGPLTEKDDSASPFYPTNYHSLNYNLLYQILIYSLYDFDKSPTSARLIARQKAGNKQPDDDDDDIPQVIKWDEVSDVRNDVMNGPESRKKRAESMKKEGLSDRTAWLLNEYAMRYGISECFGRLAYLDMLIHPFKLSTARMDLIHEVLIELRVVTSTTDTLSIPEAKMDAQLTQLLKRKIGRLIRDYHTAFSPDKVGQGALGTAIVILSFLSTHNSEKLCNMLVKYVKFAVEKTYKTFKEQATGETQEKQLVVACGFIPAAIEHDKILYIEEFPKEMNLTQVLGEQYYALISKDVRSYYSSRAKVSPNTFDLYDRLRDLQEVLNIDREHALPLKAIFSRYIDQWLNNFIKKVKKWNEESVSSDAWVPFVPPQVGEQGAEGKDLGNGDEDIPRALHSSSVVELFVSLTECRKFMNRIKCLQSTAHPVSFANAVSAVIKDYVTRVQSECFEEINSDPGQFSETVDFTVYVDLSRQLKKKLKSSEKVALIVRKELCVRINNIEHIMDNMPYFCRKVDDALGEEIMGTRTFTSMMQDTVTWLEATRQEIIDAIITKMNTFLQFALEISAQPSLKRRKHIDDDEEMTEVEKRSEALIAYLSTQLIVLSDNLYFPVFVRLLDGVWTLVLKDIELMIVPPINYVLEKTFVPKEEYRKLLPDLLDELKQFIHAEGAGLPMDAIESKCGSLIRTLGLFEESTRDLMHLFKDLEKHASSSQLPEDVGQLELTVLSVLAQRKGDKEARKFAKAMKPTAQSLMLRRRFGLNSADEIVVDQFLCVNAKMASGWLYVTTYFICFDTFLQQNDGRLAFKIEDVHEVKKHKFAKVVDNGIKFVMKSGKKYCFSGFQKRNQALSCILNQGKLLDVNLGTKEKEKGRTASADLGHGRTISISAPADESDTSDWSDADSDDSMSSSGATYRTTDASGGKKKGIKSKIARRLGKGRSGKHSRSQSLSVDPAEARSVAEAAVGTSQLSVSAKNIQSRSAANSPSLSRHVRNSENLKRRSFQNKEESDAGMSDSETEDLSDVTSDFSDTDEEFDGDDDFSNKPSGAGGANPMRSSSNLTPQTTPLGGASPFSKGHRRNQSVDHSALKKVQELGPSPHLGGSVDDLKTNRGSDKRDSKDSKTSSKDDKRTAKEGKVAAKLEAREAKEQKRKQERVKKKTAKLVKRFALTENSKFLSQLKCTYSSGSQFKGKLYIITNCICFYSSALAGVTKIVIPWGAVNSITKRQEKKGEGIEVATNDNNFVFIGFDDRDQALTKITERWQAAKKRA